MTATERAGHTAGRWVKQPGIPYVNCGEAGPCFGPVVMAGTEAEMNATARLIAAAPELYMALRKMTDALERCRPILPSMERDLKEARAALATVEGEP